MKHLIDFSLLLVLRCNSAETRGLVYVHLIAALNVHLGTNKTISKNAMSEFFYSLSMQAMSKSYNTIVIKSDATNILNKSLNNLLTTEVLAFDTAKIKRMMAIFDQPIFASERTNNKKTENSIVRNITNDEEMEFGTDTDHISMPNRA